MPSSRQLQIQLDVSHRVAPVTAEDVTFCEDTASTVVVASAKAIQLRDVIVSPYLRAVISAPTQTATSWEKKASPGCTKIFPPSRSACDGKISPRTSLPLRILRIITIGAEKGVGGIL